MEPMVERITLGFVISTQVFVRKTPLTPAPSPVLRMVPAFPGS